jgi:DNA-binding transcriptional regulator YiaG|tara:strand:+ start:574 stop:840 length:267 start_codon:yes stop_codon:yes gene_type:complete
MSIEIKKAPSHHEIKGVRLRANLSQQDCANFMGVTHRTWQRWERGDSPMPNYGWEYIKIMIDRNEVKRVEPENDKAKLADLANDWGSH